jgi:hypothetical protein
VATVLDPRAYRAQLVWLKPKSSFSKTPVALLEIPQRSQKIDASKGWPIHIREVKFAENALPQQESGKSDLAARSNDELRIGEIWRIERAANCLWSYEVDDFL